MSAVSEVVTLSDGKKVPSLAFGTYQVSAPCRLKCAHPGTLVPSRSVSPCRSNAGDHGSR